MGGEELFEKVDISTVFLTSGPLFHAVEEFRVREGDADAIDLMNHDAPRRFLVSDARSTGHEIDEEFIRHADDCVFGHIARL